MFFWMGRKMNRKLKTTGFTIAELLTVVAVLAILIGILMPALSMAKKMARETKQKAQIHSIDIGLNVFKNDHGDYPPSHGDNGSGGIDYGYCGAQTLTEALMGQDLLGFNPESVFKEGDTDNVTGYPADLTTVTGKANLESRKGPYLERENIGVFEAKDIFASNFLNNGLAGDRYVICDVFAAANRTITLPNGDTKTFKVGTPILYFRANIAKTEIDKNGPLNSIYNIYDNQLLILQKTVADNKDHEGFLKKGSADPDNFYIYIEDPLVSTSSRKRPIRPDTFLLISAGYDGLYGTADDICNFEPNIE